LRGLEVTRLDTFVDAAFAFALTRLVISFDEIPSGISEKLAAGFGLLSILLALFMPDAWVVAAGCMYFALSPAMRIRVMLAARRHAQATLDE
jgi:hypothetical protein